MRVIGNQSLLDIAVQESGSVLTVFEWALNNGKSITEPLTPGEELQEPDSNLTDVDRKIYFRSINRKIATQSEDIDTSPSSTDYLLPQIFPIV